MENGPLLAARRSVPSPLRDLAPLRKVKDRVSMMSPPTSGPFTYDVRRGCTSKVEFVRDRGGGYILDVMCGWSRVGKEWCGEWRKK